jgi:hypothetical protein
MPLLALTDHKVSGYSLARLLLAYRQKATKVVKKAKGEIMKISKVQKILPALLLSCGLGLIAAPALTKQEGKTKIKGSEKTTTKENSGRQAGELPSGIQKYTEKKGELPSGLQKMKDEDGQLTRGLEKGGKKLESSAKSKKPSK